MSQRLRDKLQYQGDQAILRSLISLSLPAIIQNMTGTLLQYVDTAMVGHLGEQATAAVSTTTTIGWLLSSMPYAVAVATVAMISQAYGAGNHEKIRNCGRLSLLVGGILGVILTVLSLSLSGLIPRWMNAEPAVQPQASRYFFIISLPLFLRAEGTILAAMLQAVKNTHTPMVISLGTNIASVILNWLLIYPMGMGVTGAAVATAITSAASGILLFIAVWRHPLLRFPLKGTKEDGAIAKEMVPIALPALGTTTASCLGYVMFAGMVGSMGTTVFAAHSIANTAEEFFYIPGYGLRTATSTLIGISIGEKNPKKFRSVRNWSTILTLLMMALSGTLLFFFAAPLMKIFTPSQAVVDLGAKVLRIVAFSEPFFGLMIVWEGIGYGMGKTRHIFLIETFSMWGIRIVLTFLVTQVWRLGLEQVWYCMIADNIFKALALSVYNLCRKPESESFSSSD